MVTLPRDLELVREVLYKAAADLGIDRLPALGAMIETPAAALCADVLSQYADFFSLGTNDLTQYTMAAGRENPSVSDYYEEENLAVYRLIDLVARNGPRAPLELCGELAARPAALQRLLEIGVQTVSVVPSLIPLVKDQICHLKLGGATLTAGLPLAIHD
jgi:phosphoenolpyruvate-protein kinase (PTS system EI component)